MGQADDAFRAHATKKNELDCFLFTTSLIWAMEVRRAMERPLPTRAQQATENLSAVQKQTLLIAETEHGLVIQGHWQRRDRLSNAVCPPLVLNLRIESRDPNRLKRSRQPRQNTE